MSEPIATPVQMNDLPEGPNSDAEAGVKGRAVDDGAEESAAGSQHPGDQTKKPKRTLFGPPASPEGFPMGAEDGPMSEHLQWGDTAYGQAID